MEICCGEDGSGFGDENGFLGSRVQDIIWVGWRRTNHRESRCAATAAKIIDQGVFSLSGSLFLWILLDA